MGKKWNRAKFPKGDSSYKQVWRIVDGAVADAFAMHPNYLAKNVPHLVVRQSIVKRVTGNLTGYVAEATRGRSTGSRVAPK